MRERGEAHVAAERELAAAAADAALDHRDRRLRHRAERLAHLVVPVQLGRRGRVGGEGEDRRDVEVGDEELGVRTAQHHDPHLRIGREPWARPAIAEEQLDGEQVDGRAVDRDGGDAVVDPLSTSTTNPAMPS